MAVFRIHKSKDFTVMSNHHLRNKELSLKAKGLLTLMLSLPDDWDYSVLGLTAMSKDGKDAVMSTLDELVKHNYLSMTMGRDDKGHITGWDYDVYETPQTGNPSSEKPYAENPNTENPPLLNTNIVNSDRLSTNGINEDNSSSRINTSKNNISSSKEKVKKGLDLSFVGIEYLNAMERWIAFHKEIGKPYTKTGVEGAYRRLLMLSNQDARVADQIVEQSIANGWQGLFELKQSKQNNNGNSSTKTQQPVNRFQELAKHFPNTGGVY